MFSQPCVPCHSIACSLGHRRDRLGFAAGSQPHFLDMNFAVEMFGDGSLGLEGFRADIAPMLLACPSFGMNSGADRLDPLEILLGPVHSNFSLRFRSR